VTTSLPPAYFEDVYGANEDPWGFATSPYEREKYAATVAALPRARYRYGFEVGCSIGVLTSLLATRCMSLLSVDVVESVVEQARERCRDLPQVRFARMVVPQEFPNDTFDLVVLSEVGYYWSLETLQDAKARIVGALEPGGHLLLVHWTPFVHDYPLTGDQVHEAFLDTGDGLPLRHLCGTRAEKYRLDLLERVAKEGERREHT
jgi:SAM-dependent methyltransferase